jgi:hypothetical protein
VRVVVALIVAAGGCGFQPSQNTQAGGDALPGTHDAAILDAPGHVVHDAPGKVFMDAPPCADDDDDGVCNAMDDWPCGAKPSAPPNHLELTDNGGHTDFKLTNLALGGTGTLAVNTTAFTAPTSPGVYELRINIGQNFSCTYQGAHTWWGGNEPPDVVGKVCVH